MSIADNVHSDVFGGKTTYGSSGETMGNLLTLKAGATNINTAVGGDTQTASGKADGNTLTVESGAKANKAIGGQAKAGAAEKNTVAVSGAVTEAVGGDTNGTASANQVNIAGGTVNAAIGGRGSTANGNSVAATEGTLQTATGGVSLTGDATDNVVRLAEKASVTEVYGAKAERDALRNRGEVLGSSAQTASIKKVAVSGAKHALLAAPAGTALAASLAAGSSAMTIVGAQAGRTAAENTVAVSRAVTGDIIGAISTSGDAVRNNVLVSADITGDVLGSQAAGSASGNTIRIENATVTGNVTGGKGAATENNTIALSGAAVTGTVSGGTAGSTGNTLAVYYNAARPTSEIQDFTNVENLHFYLGSDVSSTTPTLLQLGVMNKDITNLHVGVGVQGSAKVLAKDDVISLMKVAKGGKLTMPDTMANDATGMQGVSLLYEFSLAKQGEDELVAKVLKAGINAKTKSLTETRAGMAGFLNRGSDLLVGSGLDSMKAVTRKRGEEDSYSLWAAMDKGLFRAHTGSYVDTNGYNLAVGWAREFDRQEGKFLLSPFVEYGKGSYDSYLDDGTHGSGHVNYLGVGLLGRFEQESGLWAESAIRIGSSWSDYGGSLAEGIHTRYDERASYFSTSLGLGRTFADKAGDRTDVYLRYFYTRQSAAEATLSTGETYEFGATDSSRARLGLSYTHRDSDRSEIRAGVAYEFEFDGKATASFQGYDTASPSLYGGSYLVELAYRFAPKDSRLSYDWHVAGWQGKREGISGGVQVNWAF